MKEYFKDLKRKCIWETQKRKCILKDLKMKQTLVVDQFVLLLLLQTINLLSKNIFLNFFLSLLWRDINALKNASAGFEQSQINTIWEMTKEQQTNTFKTFCSYGSLFEISIFIFYLFQQALFIFTSVTYLRNT